MNAQTAVVTGHPFPKQYSPELLVVRRGRGVWLEDAAGRRYLDFAGGIAVNALGYGRSDLGRIAARQMRRLSHISNLFATEPGLALARAMIARGPFPFSAVFFGNSGTEANEAALKYARLYALRTKGEGHHRLHCFSSAFHGRTMGALSCTPNAKYQGPFLPLLPGVSVSAYNDVEALEKALADDVAGVIVEVVQGEGGLAAMSPAFARALNEGCRKHDAILIADEVQTGLARTGTFYASEAVGLQPDIITLAKPLAGGLPLSAALIPQKIDDLLHVGDHGTTFGGGPVTTAVALKVWQIISRPGFTAEVEEKGKHLRAGLQRLKKRFPAIGDLRGKGLLQGFEYLPGASVPAAGGKEAADPMKELLAKLQAGGLLALRSGANVVRLAPPLVITNKEIDRGITIIEEALE